MGCHLVLTNREHPEPYLSPLVPSGILGGLLTCLILNVGSSGWQAWQKHSVIFSICILGSLFISLFSSVPFSGLFYFLAHFSFLIRSVFQVWLTFFHCPFAIHTHTYTCVHACVCVHACMHLCVCVCVWDGSDTAVTESLWVRRKKDRNLSGSLLLVASCPFLIGLDNTNKHIVYCLSLGFVYLLQDKTTSQGPGVTFCKIIN